MIGSIHLYYNLRTEVSSEHSRRTTLDGLMLIDLSKCTCCNVFGNPSMTQPLTLQSVYLILFSIMLIIKSSGTNSPFLILSEITIPLSDFLEISFQSKFIVEICTSPYHFERAHAWVAQPDPGGPKIISLGGLLGL